jgi:hypothetical protein
VKIPKAFAEKIPVLVLDIEWTVTGRGTLEATLAEPGIDGKGE